MTHCNMSASDAGRISRDRVVPLLQAILRGAQADGWTDEQIGAVSGLHPRAVKSYRVEGKEPSLSAALSLAVALGPQAVNGIMAVIGYVANPVDGGPATEPLCLVADCMDEFAVIARAAADNRFDHTETPHTTKAADRIIERLTPISSRGH
jgi:hypothetical protein